MSEQYNSSDIKALGDLQAIRTRAGMYVGETNHPGQLFTEALDNALDEVQSGFSDKAVVTIDTTKNLYSVRDYGRGIPIGKSTYTDAVSGESHEIETLQLVYFKTHAGGKFGNNTAYKKSRGMHGVGLKCINALSVHAKAVTYRDGKSVILVMSKGELISLDYEDTTEPNGVYVEFIPDPDIFESPIIPINHILEISGISKAFGQHVEVYEDGTELELPYSNLYDLLPTQSNENELLRTDFTVESPTTESMTIALKYTSDTNVIYRGYTNMIPNPSGGSHLRFFEDCYKEAWNKYLDDEFRINDVLIGLRALVGVAIDNDAMAFAGQTKERLTTSKSYFEQFRSELVSKIQEYFDTHENERKGLIKRFKEYRASQNKLLANKELSQLIYINDMKGQSSSVRRKSVVDKLRECTSKSQQDTELIICFTKDMRVKLLDGTTPTFEELVSMEKTNPGRNYYVYSVDESGHTVVGRGYNPRITRYVDEIAHVILDDSTEIKCTKDHLFMMTDGHYEEAQNLKVGDSLCARYFKYCDDKEMFFDPTENRWLFMKKVNNDHDWNINNDPNNLEQLTSYDHKVAKVWIEQLDHLEPMYDFTVENYHNFVMPNEDNTSGIVVHQCEGDSAAGTLIQARDVVHQAIIPIRGKILNVSKKNSYIECMKNEEVKSIVNSAGTGIGADCDYTKSRYERYLIFTDADADGLNIASLLISIFVNLMPDLVVNGMVYVVIPPLYSWVDKGVRYYTNDISQVTNLQTMTRYKGLGEMDPAEMFDSCLDKGKQRLIQVEYPNNIDDFNESMTSSAMRYKILEGLGLIKEISI